MIGLAGLADCDALAVLHRQCFEKAWSEDEFRQLLRTENVICLLANETETHVGLILIRIAADEAEILTLGVAPTVRRRGHAKALIGAGAEMAHSRGAATFFLEVGMSNIGAMTLYRNLGLVEVGRRPAYYQHLAKQSEDALIFKAALPLVFGP